jgi:Flp pilus assembly pilin Flp
MTEVRNLGDSRWANRGQGVVGYALVIALFIITLIAIISFIGDSVSNALQNLIDALPLPS